MMSDKQFDDLFKDKLQNHSTNVPEDMWSRIEQDKRRKRPVIFWFETLSSYKYYIAFSALFLMGGFLLGKHYQGQDNEIVQEQTTRTSGSTSELNKNSVNSIDNNEPTKQSTVSVDENISTQHNAIEENKTEDGSTSVKVENNSKVLTNIASDNNSNHHIASKNKNESVENSTFVKSFTKRTASKSAAIKNQVAAIMNHDDKTANHLSELQNVIEKNVNTVENSNTENSETKLYKNLSLITADNLKKGLGKLNINLKPVHFACPHEKQKKPADWYLEVYGSPDFSFKTSVINTGTNTGYLQKKDSTESGLIGYNLGVRVMRSLADRLYIKTGFQYSQYNEQFSYRTVNETKLTTVITNKVITRSQGDTIIADTSSFAQVGYKYTKATNSFKNFEIPIILSYRNQPDENSLWNWSLSGGVILNAISWNSGSTIDTTLSVVSYNNKGANNIYTNSTLGVSMMFAASIERKLNDNWTLFSEPYFRYGLSNNISSKYGFTQKFSSVGLSLGIRYKFNHRQQY